METKKYLFCVAALFLVSFLSAQDYYFERVDGETRFVQRLAWQEVKAWRYEVVIEEFIKDDKPPKSDESLRSDQLSGSDKPFEGDEPLKSDQPLEGDEPLKSGEPLESDEPPESSESLEDDELFGTCSCISCETEDEDPLEESGTFTEVPQEFSGDKDAPEESGTLTEIPLEIAEVPPEIIEVPREIAEVPRESTEDTYIEEETLEESGTFTQVLRQFTEDPYIEVSLPPGIYRYRVTAYDFLDRPGIPSEWAQFRILLALDPDVQDFSPRALHLDGDAPWVLTLTGRNISPEAEVYLESPVTSRVIVPRKYTVDDSLSSAQLFFDLQQLIPGNYEVYVKNPGGLDTRTGTVEIGLNKKPDIYIGLAYTPLLPVYGKVEQFDTSMISPLGATVRVGVFPIKKTYGYFGVELSAGWNYLVSGAGESKASLHVAGAELNVLFQKWLPNRIMALNFRAGGGVTIATGMLLPRAEVGASFLWLIHKPFFLEAGIDGVHWFVSNGYYSQGYLRPWLGGGVKLKHREKSP